MSFKVYSDINVGDKLLDKVNSTTSSSLLAQRITPTLGRINNHNKTYRNSYYVSVQ